MFIFLISARFRPYFASKQLLEDRVVEGLRAQQADVERDRPADLARLALLHHRRHRALAAHADQRERSAPLSIASSYAIVLAEYV